MSRGQLPDFADTVHTALLLHDSETDAIVDANAAAEELYGYPLEQLREVDIARLSSASPRFSGEVAAERIRAAADGDRQQFEWQIRRADGELLWVEVGLRRVVLDGRVFVLAEIQDVTTFQRRTRRLRLLHRIIRHNLRNDMTVVMGRAEQLEAAVEDDDLERQAAVIREVAADIGSLTESVSRIEDLAGNDASDFTPTQLGPLLVDLAEEFEAAYPGATVEVDVDAPIQVSADQGLRLGLEEAVENAIEHHGEAAPAVTLRASVEDVGSRAVVSVVDDGPPIPDVEAEAIDPEEDVSEVAHGTGVGLFVMKWCAESLGGKLDVLANEPRGNVVRFTLPTIDDREGETRTGTERGTGT